MDDKTVQRLLRINTEYGKRLLARMGQCPGEFRQVITEIKTALKESKTSPRAARLQPYLSESGYLCWRRYLTASRLTRRMDRDNPEANRFAISITVERTSKNRRQAQDIKRTGLRYSWTYQDFRKARAPVWEAHLCDAYQQTVMDNLCLYRYCYAQFDSQLHRLRDSEYPTLNYEDALAEARVGFMEQTGQYR